MLLQLSCGATIQIWMWWNNLNFFFREITFSVKKKISNITYIKEDLKAIPSKSSYFYHEDWVEICCTSYWEALCCWPTWSVIGRSVSHAWPFGYGSPHPLFHSVQYITRTMHTGIILPMSPTNKRRRYMVTSSLIGWTHTQNDPCAHHHVLL